jgi:hypothetical protein
VRPPYPGDTHEKLIAAIAEKRNIKFRYGSDPERIVEPRDYRIYKGDPTVLCFHVGVTALQKVRLVGGR